MSELNNDFFDWTGSGDLNNAAALLAYGLAANIPAATNLNIGFRYYATNTQVEYQCQLVSGAPTWVEIASPGATYTADETTLHLSGETFSIISTYSGQTSIVTVGTIVTGAWEGTPIGTGHLAAFSGFTLDDASFADLVVEYNFGASANGVVTLGRIAAFMIPSLFGGRLSLTSGDWFGADNTGSQTLYLEPGNSKPSGGHNITLLSDGTRCFAATFTHVSILATDATQTGTMNGTTAVTGLTSTAQLCRGMTVTGTDIAANTTIAAIPSATTITLNQNASGSGSHTLTFEIPSGDTVDIYATNNSGAPQLQFAIVSTPAAALARLNGVLVNSTLIGSTDSNAIAAKAGVYLGSAYASSGGYLADCAGGRYLANQYNPQLKPVEYNDLTTLRSTTSTTPVQLAAGVQINVFTLGNAWLEIIGEAWLEQATAGYWAVLGIGLTTTSFASDCCPGAVYSVGGLSIASVTTTLRDKPSAGLTTYYLNFYSSSGSGTALTRADAVGDSTLIYAMVPC